MENFREKFRETEHFRKNFSKNENFRENENFRKSFRENLPNFSKAFFAKSEKNFFAKIQKPKFSFQPYQNGRFQITKEIMLGSSWDLVTLVRSSQDILLARLAEHRKHLTPIKEN
jgi:hypothetical protein